MSLNDRIVLELGRAHWARILAEEQAGQVQAKLDEAERKAASESQPDEAEKPQAEPGHD